MIKKGLEDLAKLRTYIYILFGLLVVNIFHPGIANLIHFTRSRMLYSLTMIIVSVAIICTIYIIKFASQVRENKYKKIIIMYAAKIRYFIIGIMILLAVQVAICYFDLPIIADKLMVVTEMSLIAFSLKYLTLLQREEYPDYAGWQAKQQAKAKVVEPEEEKGPKSRVGSNKAKKAAAKKRKKK